MAQKRQTPPPTGRPIKTETGFAADSNNKTKKQTP